MTEFPSVDAIGLGMDPANVVNIRAAFAAVKRAVAGRVHVGAGTVLSVEEVRAAHDAGASFIVSPDSDPAVIAETKRLGMASIPGAMTPSEIKR